MSEQPAAEPVNIRILDREYTVGVSADERTSLLAAARLLDDKMRELRGDNRVARWSASPSWPPSIWPTSWKFCAAKTAAAASASGKRWTRWKNASNNWNRAEHLRKV